MTGLNDNDHGSVSQTDFESMVNEGLRSLPEEVREKISNVAIIIADRPGLNQRRKMRLGRGSLLLGLYEGVPLTERGAAYSALPDKITLFRRDIEKAAKNDRTSVSQVVKDTVWHEVAHHFGMSETEVAQRESERLIEDQ